MEENNNVMMMMNDTDTAYFKFGFKFENFLFEGLTVTTPLGFTFLLIALISISILYEGLRQLRDYYLNQFADSRRKLLISTTNQPIIRFNRYQEPNEHGESSTTRWIQSTTAGAGTCDGGGGGDDLHSNSTEPITTAANSAATATGFSPAAPLIGATCLHMIYITIGYGLMLAVMSFNTYILISVCGGVGLGYLVFGTWRRVDHEAMVREITSSSIGGGDGGGRGNGGGGGEDGVEEPLVGGSSSGDGQHRRRGIDSRS